MDDHDEEKRRIRNLFVRSGKSEAEVSEVTDNRRLRSTYGALTTDRHEGSRGLALCYFLFITEYSTIVPKDQSVRDRGLSHDTAVCKNGDSGVFAAISRKR